MDWLKSRRIKYLASLLAIWMLMLVMLRAVFYFGFSEVGDLVHPSSGHSGAGFIRWCEI